MDELFIDFLNDLLVRLPKVNISVIDKAEGHRVTFHFRYGLLEVFAAQSLRGLSDYTLTADTIAASARKSFEEQRRELSDDNCLIHDYLIGNLPDDVKVYEVRPSLWHGMDGGTIIPVRTIPEEGITMGASAEHNAVFVCRGRYGKNTNNLKSTGR